MLRPDQEIIWMIIKIMIIPLAIGIASAIVTLVNLMNPIVSVPCGIVTVLIVLYFVYLGKSTND